MLKVTNNSTIYDIIVDFSNSIWFYNEFDENHPVDLVKLSFQGRELDQGEIVQGFNLPDTGAQFHAAILPKHIRLCVKYHTSTYMIFSNLCLVDNLIDEISGRLHIQDFYLTAAGKILPAERPLHTITYLTCDGLCHPPRSRRSGW